MCGICGIANRDHNQMVDSAVLSAMADSLRHRGPDEGGQHVAGPIGLGVRRLSIIDVSGGRQPVMNETETIHAVCNGEIYNYRELRCALTKNGHQFRSESDVEVLPHVYEEGASFLTRLRGMFALAIWDDRRRSLVLAIDRFGIKPLYYASTRSNLIFGSEMKSVLANGEVERDLDFDAVAQYFTLGYIPAPYTIFRSVRKLPPGHFLRWTSDGGVAVEQYWSPPLAATRPVRDAVETRHVLRDALRETVRSHLVSDVPLGAFLSGGVDSSAIVALMSETSTETVKTFSIGFPDPRFNELGKARMVAARFGTDHHEFIVEPDDVALVSDLVTHFDEPFADASALPTYFVSKLAKQSVKVALSGDGGDEMFVGYTMFRGLELARVGQHTPQRIRKGLLSLGASVARTGASQWSDGVGRWQNRMNDSLASPADAYRAKLRSPGLEKVLPFLSEDLQHVLRGRNPFKVIDAALTGVSASEIGHPLDRFLQAGFAVTLPGDMLVKVDRMSMANSLEVRVPLLDHVLMETIASIPVAQRFPRWRLKGLFRDCMADVLPREIVKQPKRGFNIPLTAWFREDLKPLAREVLTGRAARDRGLLDASAIERLLVGHGVADYGASSTVWSLLMFELWCGQYLDT